MELRMTDYKPFIINKSNNNGFYISDCNGFVMEYEQVKELVKGLEYFAKNNKDLLVKRNIERQREIEEEMQYGWAEMAICSKKSKRATEGYVYLFECGDKYKIGYSKNVERRLKQLDYRPYKIELISISAYLENAFNIEQALHSQYESDRVTGEWYSFNEDQVLEIKNYLEGLKGE